MLPISCLFYRLGAKVVHTHSLKILHTFQAYMQSCHGRLTFCHHLPVHLNFRVLLLFSFAIHTHSHLYRGATCSQISWTTFRASRESSSALTSRKKIASLALSLSPLRKPTIIVSVISVKTKQGTQYNVCVVTKDCRDLVFTVCYWTGCRLYPFKEKITGLDVRTGFGFNNMMLLLSLSLYL